MQVNNYTATRLLNYTAIWRKREDEVKAKAGFLTISGARLTPKILDELPLATAGALQVVFVHAFFQNESLSGTKRLA